MTRLEEYLSYYTAVMSNPLPNSSEMRRLKEIWDELHIDDKTSARLFNKGFPANG